MSNWITIDETSVRTGKISLLLDTVQATATGRGEADPLPEYIADVTAQLRAMVSAGNMLDADSTKIPKSLKGLAKRMIMRSLKDYIEYALTVDEVKKAEEDRSYLNRIGDEKLKFETPDAPAASGEMQSPGVRLVASRPREATREKMSGL